MAAVLVCALGTVGFTRTAKAITLVTFEFKSGGCVATEDTLHPTAATECGNGQISTSRTYEDTSGTYEARVSGYSNTVGDENKELEITKITQWSGGLGIKNQDRYLRPDNTILDADEGSVPEHAVDYNERLEIVLIDTHMLFNITSVEIGWIDWNGPGGGDSDFTLFAFDPLLGAPTLTGLEAYSGNPGGQNLTENGWEIIGSYDADAAGWNGDSYELDIDTDVSARYWGISAFLDEYLDVEGSECLLGKCQETYHKNGETVYDHFKVETIHGHEVNMIPLPAAGWMLIAGLGGLAAMRRRRP